MNQEQILAALQGRGGTAYVVPRTRRKDDPKPPKLTPRKYQSRSKY